jgi:hypothetical protein
MLAGSVSLGSILLSAWALATIELSDSAKVLLLGVILVCVAISSRYYLKRR